MNRFQTAEGRGEEFETAWKNRESYLEEVPGFIAFYLLRGPEGVYISCSKWESESAFVNWTESDAFRKAHAQGRTPQGVLMGPPQFSGYEVVLSQGAER